MNSFIMMSIIKQLSIDEINTYVLEEFLDSLSHSGIEFDYYSGEYGDEVVNLKCLVRGNWVSITVDSLNEKFDLRLLKRISGSFDAIEDNVYFELFTEYCKESHWVFPVYLDGERTLAFNAEFELNSQNASHIFNTINKFCLWCEGISDSLTERGGSLTSLSCDDVPYY